MHFAWLRSTFLRVLKFLQIKEGGTNFWLEPILQKVLIIWSPLLYFSFKSFREPNSSSFIRFQCILHDAEVFFSESWNFYRLKWGDLIFVGNQFWDPNSSSFIRFRCILHDSGALLWESLNFYKLKRGDLISAENQFCRKSELFGSPCCISFLKLLWTQILRH